ncbi:PIN domain-containing protein [Sulfitobacter geojensis]|uniref:PIN domain-containing protein n=1 Tax=Sulfitobacter geojensis TaxID=1342299 RepID=A0AAE3B6K4_9RHOB|nr:PIN domain-containing protein [Sulfitobacter geojensis]MBM1689269.1 PIN domain-containing protein [Sulfitobacter geojensis]MBM1693335.1 PIN domain-containing protein [Sulfitobacter geojensis]MBM1705501.1 PIN domain-containing protein [Sulfitobacter geojensis]MBM1709559.1 PIN domain-containing protein [Sulfitobacter geojensis]MBM1713625.1 PIN domain-containing protein [Sulfitobacter geojensis]
MIILDTTVILETQRIEPDPNVMEFLDGLDPTTTYTTAITVTEIMRVIGLLPSGNRRKELEKTASMLFQEAFAGRILPFDSEAARLFAVDAVRSEHPGLAVSFTDQVVAAIAKSNNGATIATRDVPRFEALGAQIVNPWK